MFSLTNLSVPVKKRGEEQEAAEPQDRGKRRTKEDSLNDANLLGKKLKNKYMDRVKLEIEKKGNNPKIKQTEK